jgi:enolase
MANIQSIRAVEILDSRGVPTLEVFVKTEEGAVASACVPSGASTGALEALELRDGEKGRYFGKGVRKAIAHVHGALSDLLVGKSVLDQRGIDEQMIAIDGTMSKSHLGANAILGVSLAVARAGALTKKQPLYQYLGPQERYGLPCPMMNIINGGMHADNSLDIQEFMIRPKGAKSFAEAVRWGAEIFHELKKLLRINGFSTAVGDEGGFAPNFSSNKQALDYMMQAVESAGYTIGDEVSFALDVAASFLYDKESGCYIEKKKKLASKQSEKRSREEQVDLLKSLCMQYPIDSIEDGMAEEDVLGWQHLTEALGKDVQLVGDDNFVTNTTLLQQGINLGCANAILIKVNQIGTLTEALDCVQFAKKNHYGTIVSHRSGETEDPILADICVGFGCQQIKTGSLSRSDRTAKYNRLLVIEDELQKQSFYSDSNPYYGLYKK